jgi:predicted nucleotidyltransferase
MIAIVFQKTAQIAALCRRFSIQRLEVFGPAVKGTFNEEKSDLDFIVDLGEYEPHVADRFLDFADALEKLLGYRVDLITEQSITSPYFQRSVNAAREWVYEARDGKAVA